ncbi:hypothetical protein GN956_G21675 [Arapaima gigas]
MNTHQGVELRAASLQVPDRESPCGSRSLRKTHSDVKKKKVPRRTTLDRRRTSRFTVDYDEQNADVAAVATGEEKRERAKERRRAGERGLRAPEPGGGVKRASGAGLLQPLRCIILSSTSRAKNGQSEPLHNSEGHQHRPSSQGSARRRTKDIDTSPLRVSTTAGLRASW